MSNAVTTGETPAPGRLDHAAIRSIVLGILLAMLLAALDQTIVATALPTIGRDLHDLENLPWVVTSYLLTSTAVTPLYGKFSDIHGRRVALLISIGMFILGSVICGAAPSMTVLVLGRAVQGLGGGGLISLAQTIIADVIPPRERGRYQGYIASVFVTSSVAGPVVGGFFAEHLHWSLIFWINLPLGLVAFWMTNSTLKRLPKNHRPGRLDLIGAGLMVTATVLFLLALSWGGHRFAWTSLPILGLLAASIAGFILFAIWLWTGRDPLLPLPVILNPVVRMGTAAALCGMGVFIGLSIYVPSYLQSVLGLSISDSGLASIPLMGGTVTGATIAGRSMMKVRQYKRLPMVGLVAAGAALLVLAYDPHGLPFVVVEIALGVIGLGIGTLLPVTTVAIQNAVEPHQMGVATASMNFFRSLGGAVIVAIFGAILLQALDNPASDAVVALADLAHSFRLVFIAATIGLALALTFLVLMEERPLRSSNRSPGNRPDVSAAAH